MYIPGFVAAAFEAAVSPFGYAVMVHGEHDPKTSRGGILALHLHRRAPGTPRPRRIKGLVIRRG